MSVIEILIYILAAVYLIAFICVYVSAFHEAIRRRIIKRFYTAIKTIQEEGHDLQDEVICENCFSRLKLNFDQLRLSTSFYKDNMTDTLKTVINYYDSKSESSFQAFFKQKKDPAVQSFALTMYMYIKERYPFADLPKKDADLLSPIMDTFKSENNQFGINALMQVAQEIANKEQIIHRKTKENQVATIISIVGTILTLIFGILSIVQRFN